MMILTGSTRLKQLFPNYPHEPKDLDYFVSERIDGKDSFCDLNSKPIVEYLYNPVFTQELDGDDLFTLKISHIPFTERSKPEKFLKHLSHVKFLEENGCKLKPELLSKLVEFWKEIKVRKEPNFELDNDNFFQDKVQREITHDELHEFFKFGDSPAFNLIKSDKSKAAIDLNLWENLDHEHKIIIVLEEIFTLSYERGKDLLDRSSIMESYRSLVCSLLPLELAIFSVINHKIILSRENTEIYKSMKNKLAF